MATQPKTDKSTKPRAKKYVFVLLKGGDISGFTSSWPEVKSLLSSDPELRVQTWQGKTKVSA